MIFRYLSGLCLLWLSTWSLLGCGGGGSGAGTGATVSPSLVQPGVFYSSAVNGQDFWGVITPAAWGNRWYGLYYAASPSIEDPDIFSGSLDGIPSETALIQGFKYFPLNAGYKDIYQGNGKLTSPADGKLSGQLTFSSTAKFSKPNIDFSAAQVSAYTYNQPAKLSDIANTWIGRLSYGEGSNGSFAFTVSPTSGVIADSASFGLAGDCKWKSSNSWLEPGTKENIFKLTLAMSVATSCGFQGQTLTGVALVFKSPVAGKTQRLIWVATTAEGQGMSFKADR